MNEETTVSVHWSFWVIGAVGLVFNLMGCANYVWQTNAGNVASLPDVYQSIVETRPAWGTGAFAIAVFGGALGCLLLLFRKSVAIYVLFLALLGALVSQIPYLQMAEFPISAWIGWFSQSVVAAFLIWHARRAATRGWIS